MNTFMKTSVCFAFAYLCTACLPLHSQSIPAGAIKGDFNGDGKPDYVWIVKPTLNTAQDDCDGPCVVHIKSTIKGAEDIVVKQAIGGTLTNLGDLKGNRHDEIGFLPEWFTSCWRGYLTYQVKANQWQPLTESIPTHCNLWEAGVFPITKLKGNPGVVQINYSVIDGDSILVKTKFIKL